jgi:beta-galactosidase GanA
MGWNYGKFINQVAAAGKKEYPIPMYVNTWLSGPTTSPGRYPSGGPLPEVIDLWKAAGDGIDIYSPDIYAPNFSEWCERYHHGGNPLFIPETRGGADGEANVFYALGAHDAMGFSPFGIDSWMETNSDLDKAYAPLMQMADVILQHQGSGQMTGFLLDKDHPSTSVEMNGYQVEISLDEIFGSKAEQGYGLVMATAPNEFLGIGRGFRVSFTAKTPGPSYTGIGYVEEGTFSNGSWIPGRRLNGDENDQGKFWRFAPQRINTERVVVYRAE